MARKRQKADPWHQAVLKGWEQMRSHPLFRYFGGCFLYTAEEGVLPHDRWAYVTPSGAVHHNPRRRAEAAEWAWVFAHCLLHAGFGHLDPRTAAPEDLGREVRLRAGQPMRPPHPAYLAACCLSVDRFLATLRIGRPPVPQPAVFPPEDERTLTGRWRETGVPPEFGVPAFPDFFAGTAETAKALDHQRTLAIGISAAAVTALDLAGGVRPSPGTTEKKPWEAALGWFVSSYPLLGALAAGMTIVADADLARGWDITVAAVNAQAAEIYVNPLISLSVEEWRFVLAHEMLHAALRHGDRAGWREPYLWNVACDYVVNGWLVEMGVGEMPEGLLHDPSLRGLSCEMVYDRIATDLRRTRRRRRRRGISNRGGHRPPGTRAGTWGDDPATRRRPAPAGHGLPSRRTDPGDHRWPVRRAADPP